MINSVRRLPHTTAQLPPLARTERAEHLFRSAGAEGSSGQGGQWRAGTQPEPHPRAI